MYKLSFYCPVCGEQKVISIDDINQEYIEKDITCHNHKIHVDYDCIQANLKVSADMYLKEVK